jgi:FMN phosphatase YigB (HAD superfamily)
MIKAVIFDFFGVIVSPVGRQGILDDVLWLHSTYKTAILSNTSLRVLNKYFPGGEYKEYFDELILSYDEGINKPNPDIYFLAAERLGVNVSECLFVDDSEGNVRGAENVGMNAILYRGREDFVKKLRDFGIKIPENTVTSGNIQK